MRQDWTPTELRLEDVDSFEECKITQGEYGGWTFYACCDEIEVNGCEVIEAKDALEMAEKALAFCRLLAEQKDSMVDSSVELVDEDDDDEDGSTYEYDSDLGVATCTSCDQVWPDDADECPNCAALEGAD